MFGFSEFGEKTLLALVILSLVIMAASFTCNVIYMAVTARGGDPNGIFKSALMLKALHVPAYILIFVFGVLLVLFAFLFATPIFILLIAINVITLFLSGMISVYALVKMIRKILHRR